MRKPKPNLRPIWCAVILSISGCSIGGAGQDFCAAVPEPAPFPKKASLEIFEGDLIVCDAGCERLVQEYSAQIGAHRAACGNP
jgi:hypothetical protein